MAFEIHFQGGKQFLHVCTIQLWLHMMTSWWHWNIFCITGPLWGQSTSHQWVPSQRATYVKLWYFRCFHPQTSCSTNRRVVGDIFYIWYTMMLMWHHCNEIICRYLVASPMSLWLLWWPPTGSSMFMVVVMLLMYSVLHCLYSVGNKITTTTTTTTTWHDVDLEWIWNIPIPASEGLLSHTSASQTVWQAPDIHTTWHK